MNKCAFATIEPGMQRCTVCGQLARHRNTNIYAECRGPKPIGLGDMVAAGLAAVGITKERVAALVEHLADIRGAPASLAAATGSELPLAIESAKVLEGEGKKVRVVSMPIWELFEEQEQSYRCAQLSLPSCCCHCTVLESSSCCLAASRRCPALPAMPSGALAPCPCRDSVLPPDVKARVSVEAASTFGWGRWVGDKGVSIGVDEFGASAPAPLLYEKYGITKDAIVAAAKKTLAA